MTLPNRAGYHVEGANSQAPPEPSNFLHNSSPTPQLHLSPPLYQFGPQPEVLKMVERSLGIGSEISPNMDYVSHVPSMMIPNPRFDSDFRPPLDTMDVEVQVRKNFVRNHKFLPYIVEFVNSSKKEGISPSINTFSMDTHLQLDFSLDEFLVSQGLDNIEVEERDEFATKLEHLKTKYTEELEKLNKVCEEFAMNMYNLLREQSTIRPVTEHEVHLKLHGIHQKFDYVKNHLKQNVCNAIVTLSKQSNHSKKKKRALPKKSAELLAKWFFEHLNDPYPSEEEKAALASAGGLTITQVNNWFGNKRIRYKKKCLSEEAKRSGVPMTDAISNTNKGIVKDGESNSIRVL